METTCRCCDWFEWNRLQLSSTLQVQGLKHYWVAEAIGVHKTTLRRWLNGNIRFVHGAYVRRLASLLEVSDDAIAREVPKMHSQTIR